MTGETIGAASAAYRKKRVKRIKKIIVGVVIALLVLPILISIFLLVKVYSLEKEIQKISDNKARLEREKETDVVKAKEKEVLPTEEPQAHKVYLTFDDGPGVNTKKILNILKKQNVKATFFVNGKEDAEAKKLYKRIVKEGHTLGMHSYSHIYKEIYGSLEGFQKDFEKISELLFDVTGVRSMYYRFPGGSGNSVKAFSIEEYRNFLAGQGVTYQDWNVIAANGTTDHVTQKDMVASVMDGVARYDTSIVLMYDSADKKMTAKSLEAIIDNLQAAGYELLPIDGNTTPVQHS